MFSYLTTLIKHAIMNNLLVICVLITASLQCFILVLALKFQTSHLFTQWVRYSSTIIYTHSSHGQLQLHSLPLRGWTWTGVAQGTWRMKTLFCSASHHHLHRQLWTSPYHVQHNPHTLLGHLKCQIHTEDYYLIFHNAKTAILKIKSLLFSHSSYAVHVSLDTICMCI